MPSDENNPGPGRPAAVLYVGPPDGGEERHVTAGIEDRAAADVMERFASRRQERLEAEARAHAVEAGLSPLNPAARTLSEADALLAEHAEAELVVHPGAMSPVLDPEPGAVLWNLLRAGAVLRLCDLAAAGAPQRPPRLPRRGAPVVLVLDLRRGGKSASRPDQWREAECRAYATRHRLRVLGVFTGDPTSWSPRDQLADLLLGRLPSGERLTVVVHPDANAPDPGTPDALLWRWLRRGLVIHSGRSVYPDRQPPASAPRASLPGPGRPPVRGRRDRTDVTVGTSDARLAPDAHGDLPVSVRAESSSGNYHFHGKVTGSQLVTGGTNRRAAFPSPPPPGPTPRDTSQPLPHNGLFTRRNNAFGTRSVLGIKDLIEQGVIIGQDQIRFDDFVAARTDQVPGPPPGEAIAVRHGLAAVPGEFKANEATTHFVEIALRARDAQPEDAPAAEPLPVNFVFVVDTSISMKGEKLDTVKSALQTIYNRLRPADCLGIITFAHEVRTVLPAVTKKELSPARFTEVVSALTAAGGTDIDLGVQYGIDEISRHARSGRTVNCLYLFSDGDPTSGERDWIKIRTNVAAKLRGDLTLSCFGFGSDARMPELAALAGLAGGHSTFVTRPEQVRTDLLSDLSRRDHLAAVDIQLRLDIDPAVEIRHLYGHDLVTDPRTRARVFGDAAQAAQRAQQDYGTKALPDIITEEKGIRIFAPDLAFDETYWVVLEVRVPPGRELSGLGTAVVQYVDTVAREGRRHEIDLTEALTLSEETVTVHAIGLWTSEVTFYALDDLYAHDRESAKERLTRHIQTLEAVHRVMPAGEFRDDQVTMRKLMTLAGTLGSAVSFTDGASGGGYGSAVRAMNTFGRVRSGFSPLY